MCKVGGHKKKKQGWIKATMVGKLRNIGSVYISEDYLHSGLLSSYRSPKPELFTHKKASEAGNR